MRRWIQIGGTQLTTCLALSAILFMGSSCTARKQDTAPKLVRLKVVAEPFLTYAPLFIAQDEGFFAQQGLEVEFVKFDRTSEAVATLINGDVDVAGGLLNAGFLNAIARGARIRVVANKGYYGPSPCEYSAVVVRPELVRDSQLATAAHWRKYRVKVNRMGLSGFAAEKLFKTLGLTLDDLEIHDLPEPMVPDALAHGAIDAAFISEPWLTRSTATGAAVIWQSLQPAVSEADMALLFFGHNLLDTSPEIGKRFIVAYLQGVRQYKQGKTGRNLQIISKYTGFDSEWLKQLCWVPFRDDGQINLGSFAEFNAWAVKKGIVERTLRASEIFDSRFVQPANQLSVLGGR